MRKISIYISFFTLALIGFSCDSELDKKPFQSIKEDDALSNAQSVRNVLVGAYDALGNSDLFGGNNQRDAELLASNNEIRWQGTFQDPRDIYNKAITTTNVDVTETWLESYEAINIANNVLSALEVFRTETEKDQVEGEALFIRAMVYFDLVRFFAKPYSAGNATSNPGVPLILTPTRGIDGGSFVSRNSVEEVYNQIIADLTKAEAQLASSNGFFATSGAAAALLARVYLNKADYSNALAAANRVIASGNYALASTYASAFNNGANSVEDIFAAQVTTQDGVNNMANFFAPAPVGRGDIPVLQSHLDLYEAGDRRLAFFYTQEGDFWSGKFVDQFANVPVIRLAEMYLTRAECNQRLSSVTGATPLADINLIRSRAGLDALTSVDLDQILLERKLELSFEGHTVHDMKRLQMQIDGLSYDANQLVFPIPQREINANPSIQQNPGY